MWLAKPWKVVGANRKSATNVQKIVQNLKDKPSEWEENLLHVLELYVVSVIPRKFNFFFLFHFIEPPLALKER